MASSDSVLRQELAFKPSRMPSTARSLLLVSVRSVEETQLALDEQVDWIDVKEPSQGSLGGPSLETATVISRMLRGYGSRSVALGELRDLSEANVEQLVATARLFPVAKIGLAGSSVDDDWETRLLNLAVRIGSGTRLVPVLYADYETCHAPKPAAVLAVAKRIDGLAKYEGKQTVLVDTFAKNGGSCLDVLSKAELAQFVVDASKLGANVVLAGSIQAAEIGRLLPLKPFAIAVRGAVCKAGRISSICPQKLHQLVQQSRRWPEFAG